MALSLKNPFSQMFTIWISVISLLSVATAAQSLGEDTRLQQLQRRALSQPEIYRRVTAEAPRGYTPANIDCPSVRPSIRSADALSSQEVDWLKLRRNAAVSALQAFLNRAGISGLDVNSYFNTHGGNLSSLPNIGIAVAGGGYRALNNGAGVLAAFDNRTDHSLDKGQLGGILQATTYLSGLSGGSWLVGSLAINNFSSVQDLQRSQTLWQFENPIYKGPSNLSPELYYAALIAQVAGKDEAGYDITLTDYWGRALSFQLINSANGGPSFTFSAIADDPQFAAGSVAMPLIVAVDRAYGQLVIPTNSTVIEFNPWEMGTFDRSTHAFAPLKYVGSSFDAGSLPSNQSCVGGYDNAGFIMGTSSSLFNEFYLARNMSESASSTLLQNITLEILKVVGETNFDIAEWVNPFYQYNTNSNPNAPRKTLTLVDGGEDKQNIPFHPLIQRERAVDVIFAVDSSADTEYNWPNGIAMVTTYQRSQSDMGNGTLFPAVPDNNTFVNLGLNKRPTFFGCNASNFTDGTPLIVYLPNAPYSYNSNLSTFDLDYNISQRNSIIQNGYNGATRGNSSQDKQWSVCVGCAILSRSLHRTNTPIPSACTTCYANYCWNGTVNSTLPYRYDPHVVQNGGNPALSRDILWAVISATITSTALILSDLVG